MKLYHGSKLKITNPIPYGSSPSNDYGPAFYLTKDLQAAHEWACRNSSVGIVNEYNVSLINLKILDLTDGSKYSVLHWVAILLHFRTLSSSFTQSFNARLKFIENNYYIDVRNYDLIIGYRADDAYFRFPLDFVRGNITLEQLDYSFRLGKLGIQYVLISERSFKNIQFIKAYQSSEKYISYYYNNVTDATNRFDNLNKDEEGTRILDIMRGKK